MAGPHLVLGAETERRPNHAGLCCRRQRRRRTAARADAGGTWPPGHRDGHEREVPEAIRATRRGAGRRRRPRCRRDRRGRGPGRAGRDHPRDDGPVGHARLPALRPLVRADEPAPDRGHGEPARRGPGERRQAVRRPELHRLEQQPDGPLDQDGGRPARSAPGQGADRDARRDPVPRACRPRRAARGDRRPLRRPLRPRLVGDARRDPPQADVPGHRRRRGHRVVDPRRRRGRRRRSPPSSAAAAASTTSSTTNRRRPASSSRPSPRRSGRRRRCGSRPGSAGCSPARWRSR